MVCACVFVYVRECVYVYVCVLYRLFRIHVCGCVTVCGRPAYKTKEDLREKLTIAIEETEGFGLE